jgi:hypothetical protein
MAKPLIDLLGNKINPGDICAFSVRGWGMELGVFVKETPKKLSFRIPCWWCIDRDQHSVSAINKNRQRQRVLVIKEPWFFLDAEKILILLNLKDILITKGTITNDYCGRKTNNQSNQEKEAEEDSL